MKSTSHIKKSLIVTLLFLFSIFALGSPYSKNSPSSNVNNASAIAFTLSHDELRTPNILSNQEISLFDKEDNLIISQTDANGTLTIPAGYIAESSIDTAIFFLKGDSFNNINFVANPSKTNATTNLNLYEYNPQNKSINIIDNLNNKSADNFYGYINPADMTFSVINNSISVEYFEKTNFEDDEKTNFADDPEKNHCKYPISGQSCCNEICKNNEVCIIPGISDRKGIEPYCKEPEVGSCGDGKYFCGFKDYGQYGGTLVSGDVCCNLNEICIKHSKWSPAQCVTSFCEDVNSDNSIDSGIKDLIEGNNNKDNSKAAGTPCGIELGGDKRTCCSPDQYCAREYNVHGTYDKYKNKCVCLDEFAKVDVWGNGECKCTKASERNKDTNKCECIANATERHNSLDGKTCGCKQPRIHNEKNNTCDCPNGSVSKDDGSCSCEDPKKIPVLGKGCICKNNYNTCGSNCCDVGEKCENKHGPNVSYPVELLCVPISTPTPKPSPTFTPRPSPSSSPKPSPSSSPKPSPSSSPRPSISQNPTTSPTTVKNRCPGNFYPPQNTVECVSPDSSYTCCTAAQGCNRATGNCNY